MEQEVPITTEEMIKKYRPLETTMDAVRQCCVGKIDMIEDEWRLERDVFERLRKLNNFVKERTPEITSELAAEVLYEFFRASDVSYATEGIREDLKRNTTILEDGVTKCVNHFLRPSSKEEEDGSYLRFLEWVNDLSGDTSTTINYFAKFHHCGCHSDIDGDRIVNCINLCENASRTSFMLQLIHRTCPSGVVYLQSPHQSSFNVDRTLDHCLFIAEEAPSYLISKPKTITNTDATNILAERLTKGTQTTLHFFVREEDNRRDMKYVKTSSRGSILMATTGMVIDGDKNLLSRFMFVNPDGGAPDRKELTDLQLSQHRDLHRLYFITEMMIKSGVTKVDTNDVETMIRDTLLEFGVDKLFSDRHTTKRIMGMARTICIAYTIWRVMMSPEFLPLQYDSHDPTKYIGINVRLFTEGIFPLLVIDKKMVFTACSFMQS